MWPQEYIQLKHIEDLLICGICYEYMETSVATSCSHNYCSLCIRKYLHYKTQCPVCFAETFEKDLRINKALDEIISQFLRIKDKLKRCLQIQIQFVQSDKGDITLNSPKLVHEKKEVHLNKQENKIISRNVILNASPSTNVQKDLCSPSTSGRPKIPLMFTPKSSKRLIVTNMEDTKVVICPVCKVTISETNINRHLDDCLKREANKDQPQIMDSKRKPLPKLVFTLMKDAILRKKSKEFGLSSQGDRRALETRLQRYIVLYNAECDKPNPRSIPELLKQCEDEENLEKKINKSSVFMNKLQINRNTEQNVIDDERKKYLETHKNSFESLIKKIKTINSPRKPSVRRNLLNESIEGHESPLREIVSETSDDSVTEKNDFQSINPGVYIQDSDSDTSCPLQMYSSTDPKQFLNISLSPSNNNVSKIKCEMVRIQKEDCNSDACSDVSVTSKGSRPIMNTPNGKNVPKSGSRTPCNATKYKMLLQRKEKPSVKDEMREMDSISISKVEPNSNNVSDQEEANERLSPGLQDILCDLSSNDSIDSKSNHGKSRAIDHGYLNSSIVHSSNLEKENISSSPECGASRSLRKRSRDYAQNDRVVSSMKKKIKKSSQCYPSETDESNNEEPVSALNQNEQRRSQNKSRIRRRVTNSVVEDTSVVRKSVRTRLKNNIL
ncbi:uncharacterized protein LOC143371327 [Andrena cerasifolii]|uniref:uncharacterized protein LOC143371327 n=1 Tax=Andrena cerasifolii TaxID=2819439 RepID=UPI0040379C84